MFYYRGLSEWDDLCGYLMDTCLTAQDRLKKRWTISRFSIDTQKDAHLLPLNKKREPEVPCILQLFMLKTVSRRKPHAPY